MTRILVIDDEPAVRTVIELTLQRAGFDVELAKHGHAGVAAIESGAFDLAIVDMFMPGMGGSQTIAAIRRIAPGVAIIAMSGIATPCGNEAEISTDAHVAPLLRLLKPFRPDKLLTAVQECLSHRNGTNRAVAS